MLRHKNSACSAFPKTTSVPTTVPVLCSLSDNPSSIGCNVFWITLQTLLPCWKAPGTAHKIFICRNPSRTQSCMTPPGTGAFSSHPWAWWHKHEALTCPFPSRWSKIVSKIPAWTRLLKQTRTIRTHPYSSRVFPAATHMHWSLTQCASTEWASNTCTSWFPMLGLQEQPVHLPPDWSQ